MGDDTLEGSVGNDAMIGGKGDDLYYVESAADKVTEAANQGSDTVYSDLANYTLAANVERLGLFLGSILPATRLTISSMGMSQQRAGRRGGR